MSSSKGLRKKFKKPKKMSKESGAISLLCRAVELDSKNNKTSALVCYKEGLQMLLEVIRTGMYF